MLSGRERKCLGGYMTLEAAFIVPWVIFIIVWLIYLGFFEYNRCQIFQEDYALAAQTAGQICSESEQSSWMNSRIGSQGNNRYIAAKNLSRSGEVSGTEIIISSRLKTTPVITTGTGMIPTGNWQISDKVTAANFSYTKRLRIFRAAGRILNGEN